MFTRKQPCSEVSLALLIVSGLLCLGLSSSAWALPIPAKKTCDQQEVYDRVKCRHDAVADQLTYTSETVFSPDSKITGRVLGRGNSARLHHIKNAHAKGQRAKEKYNRETFKKMAKNEAKATRRTCHLVPLTASDDVDGDGICDYEQGDSQADCAAIDLNPIDNSLQKCNPEKKNKGKGNPSGNPKFAGLECDLSCDQSSEPDNDAERVDMEGSGEQLEATFSAVEEDLIEMNMHLMIVEENLPEDELLLTVSQSGCVFPELTPGLSEAVWGPSSFSAIATSLSREYCLESSTHIPSLLAINTERFFSTTEAPT